MALFDSMPGMDTPEGQGLLAAAFSLLQARKMPGERGIGGALGAAGQQYMGTRSQAQDQMQRRKFQDLQMTAQQKQLEAQQRAEQQRAADEAAVRGGIQGGNFDPRQFLQSNPSASLGALEQAMKFNGALNPAPKFETVAPGSSMYRMGPNGPELAMTAPDKPQAPEKDPEVIRQLKIIYGEGTPAYLSALKRLGEKTTSHQPAVNVSYGAPVAGVDATGNPVFFQPSKDGSAPSIVPGVAPPKSPLSAGLTEKMAQNEVTLQKIDEALSLVEKRPSSLGLQNALPDALTQRMDPAGVDVRAIVADIGGQKIHDRSGAAVTVGESERLKPYIPSALDTPATVTKKLKLFKSEYEAMQQAIRSGASIGQAARKQSAMQPKKNITVDY